MAIVCAPAAMIETGGGEFLTMAHRLYPAAKRVLIVPRGGPSAPSLRVPAALLHDASRAAMGAARDNPRSRRHISAIASQNQGRGVSSRC